MDAALCGLFLLSIIVPIVQGYRKKGCGIHGNALAHGPALQLGFAYRAAAKVSTPIVNAIMPPRCASFGHWPKTVTQRLNTILALCMTKGRGCAPERKSGSDVVQKGRRSRRCALPSRSCYAYAMGEALPPSYSEALKWLRKPRGKVMLSHSLRSGFVLSGCRGHAEELYSCVHVVYGVSARSGLGKDAKAFLAEIAPDLAPSQIAEAQRLAERCIQSNFKTCNE